MSCECQRVCTLPKCCESIMVGTIAADTEAIVQFKNIITGKIKQLQATANEDGELTVDTSLINSFFTENFTYEVTVLNSNKNQCDTIEWAIGETVITCVTINFENIPISEGLVCEFTLVV